LDYDDQYINFIESILKRKTSLPRIVSGLDLPTNQDDTKKFLSDIIHLIKHQYIERQKKIVNEFKKKCSFLKKQEELQFETVKEIEEKCRSMMQSQMDLTRRYDNLLSKQSGLEKM
jgi:hypothetical protein